MRKDRLIGRFRRIPVRGVRAARQLAYFPCRLDGAAFLRVNGQVSTMKSPAGPATVPNTSAVFSQVRTKRQQGTARHS